jgi:hypothetical protein
VYDAIKYLLACLIWSEEVEASAIVTSANGVCTWVIAINRFLRFCPPVQFNSDPTSRADSVYSSNDATDNSVTRTVGPLVVAELDGQLRGCFDAGSRHVVDQ